MARCARPPLTSPPSPAGAHGRHPGHPYGVRIAAAIVLVGLGAVTLSFGGNDVPTYGWTAFWLVLAAAQFSVAYWYLTIARSGSART
jgi:hypothetical protein